MRRRRRLLLSVSLLALTTACASGVGAEEVTDVTVAGPRTTVRVDVGEDRDVVEPQLPVVAPVAPPDMSQLGETGDIVAERLGDLASPTEGIDVVGATCAEDGGELQYSGSTGDDVFAVDAATFDIAEDGTGTYVSESPAGLTTVEVGPKGSGRYYSEEANELLTITVEPDRSGEYYHERRNGLVTVEVNADGTGEFYDDTDDRLLTVTLNDDGSGRLFHETDDELTTVDAAGDGSGEMYRKTVDGVATIVKQADGGWEFDQTTSTHVVTLTVEPDGSGTYDEAGRTPLMFDFDADGRSADGRRIVLPPTPEFSVAERLPALGTLGTLAPPCAAVIRLDSQVLFDYDEAELKSAADPVLDDVVATLAEADKPIEIIGHTDSIGRDQYNLDLSLERAQAVEAALRQRGLAVDMSVDGRGESEPVAQNETADGQDDPAGRAQNRRVDITIRD